MSNIRSTMESLNNRWNDAFNRGDSKALAALYSEDATLSPGNGQALKGRDQVAQLFQSFFDGGVHGHTLEIIEAGGNDSLIYQVARWAALGATQDGKTPAFGGITSSVIERTTDGSWQTRSHVWNAAG